MTCWNSCIFLNFVDLSWHSQMYAAAYIVNSMLFNILVFVCWPTREFDKIRNWFENNFRAAIIVITCWPISHWKSVHSSLLYDTKRQYSRHQLSTLHMLFNTASQSIFLHNTQILCIFILMIFGKYNSRLLPRYCMTCL